METAPKGCPSDISEFMSKLGFEWSNDAQVYYCDQFDSKVNTWHIITSATAEHLYWSLVDKINVGVNYG